MPTPLDQILPKPAQLGNTNGAALGAAAPGTAPTAARSDHVHPLPALATTSAAGLMSAADKTKLDGIEGGGGGGGGGVVTHNTQNGTYAYSAADAGTCVIKRTTASVFHAIPLNSSTPIPVGTTIDVRAAGAAGSITLTRAIGVALRQAGSPVDFDHRISASGRVRLTKEDTDAWVVQGDGLSIADASAFFEQGEPGVWFDFGDTSTMFSDAQGLNPITPVVGSPVGLVLDKSRRLARGPELCPDPQFLVAATWQFTGATPGWVIVAGEAQIFSSASGLRFIETVAQVLTPGRWYEVSVDIQISNAGSFGVELGTSLTPPASDYTPLAGPVALVNNQRQRRKWIAYATGTRLRLFADGAFNGSITNLSCRELLGQHARQRTAANRPVLTWRANELLESRNLGASPWTTTATVTAGQTGSENQSSASLLVPADTTSFVSQPVPRVGRTAGTSQFRNTMALRFKASGLDSFRLSQTFDGNNLHQWIEVNPITGSFTTGTSGVSLPPPLANVSVSAADANGWRTLYANGINADSAASIFYVITFPNATNANGVNGVLIDAPFFSGGVVAYTPQYVTPSGVPLERTGFHLGLQFDGTNDSLEVPGFTFGTGVNEITAIVALTHTANDHAFANIIEASTNSGSNNGSFVLTASSSGTYSWEARGAAAAFFQQTCTLRPVDRGPELLSLFANVTTSTNGGTHNGVAATNATGAQGAGPYLTYPLFIGARAGTSRYFNGRMWQLLIRGAGTPDRTQIDAYIRANTANPDPLA